MAKAKKNEEAPADSMALTPYEEGIYGEGDPSSMPPPPVDRERDIRELLEQVRYIDALAESGQNVMEMAISAGQDASKGVDLRRYVIGALCGTILRKYGDSDVETFAKGCLIGVSTARQYEGVVAFYTLQVCVNLTNLPNVSYSHIRLAKATNKRDVALGWLDKVAEYSWTTEQLTAKIYGEYIDSGDDDAPPPGSKEIKAADVLAEIMGFDTDDKTVTVRVGDALPNLMPFGGKRLHVIFKVPTPPTLPASSQHPEAAQDDPPEPPKTTIIVEGVAREVDPETGEVIQDAALVLF